MGFSGRILAGAAVLSLAMAGAATAQLPERPEPIAEVMVLGTYHFANPGLDAYNAEADDMLSPRRQAEIAELAEGLMAFAPTAVAVEAAPGGEMQARYEAYLDGAELARNESQQIGFRVAKLAGLSEISPIDVQWDFMSEAQQALDMEAPRMAAIGADMDTLGRGFTGALEAVQADATVGETLAWMNTPEALQANSDFYLGHMIRMWDGENAGGAMTVANWYTRNILIFQNLIRVAEAGGPGGRILVVYGQGHAPILRQMIADSPWLTLADPLDYLPDPPAE